MNLSPGALLGPYEILAAIGAGGMGEVYRGRDTRLGRDVAIKVLSPKLAATPEARARFEREARTISQLNHPHICVLHDIGHEGDTDYLVMELLEGETLEHRLERGPLPVAEVLSLGAQIADALDRAHCAGVVHRDLKPGNVMLTKRGAKLMDFGLARVGGPAGPARVTGRVSPPGLTAAGSGPTSAVATQTDSPTTSRSLTAEGTIIGTFQYMAPEQLEGKEADARTDLWALGCVLYEMATGKRAFEGASQASLIVAIMDHEPPAMTKLQPLTPPVLEHLVSRCLAKDPADRWQSAADLARELEWVAAAGSATGLRVSGDLPPARLAVHLRKIAAIILAAVSLAVVMFFVGRLAERRPEPPTFTQMTFERGGISNARFAPDGRSVVYSATWEGRPPEIFETRTDLSTTRPLGLHDNWLHAVSRTGELAVSRGEDSPLTTVGYGPLAIVPASGSAPRDLVTNVSWADWSPDGKTLAVVRRMGPEDCLEMPPGHVLATTSGRFSDVRISPNGRRIAFAEHPVVNDTRGSVAVVDMSGRKTTLTHEFSQVEGLAWWPSGREIWFSAAPSVSRMSLFAVTVSGRLRTVAHFPTSVFLHDLAPGGRVLLTALSGHSGIRGGSSVDGKEIELGWLDYSWPRALSVDGKLLLLDDEGETGGSTYTTYIRSMDGSPPVELGKGAACALSPDGRWALTVNYGPPHRLVQIPTGSGDALTLPRGRVETYESARWLPDGRRIVFVGAEAGRPHRTWIQDLSGGLPSPVTPEGTKGTTTSPDGRWLAAAAPDSTLLLFPLQGGEPRSVAKLDSREEVCQWSADGRALFVSRKGRYLDVFGIDVQSGNRRLWKRFEMLDPVGVWMAGFVVTPDGRHYAYGYVHSLSELYLVEGLR